MTGQICLKFSLVCYLNLLKSSYLCTKKQGQYKYSLLTSTSPPTLSAAMFSFICFQIMSTIIHRIHGIFAYTCAKKYMVTSSV